MADALDATVEVSLGHLAVAQGVITAPQRDDLGVALLRRATSKQPTSMARLLLQGGLTASAVQGLLARGAHYPAVRCDACELSIPQGQLRRREEVPCPRCGSLVLGFAIYAQDPEARDEADDESTATEPPPEDRAGTERWSAVLPLPGAAAAARERAPTDRWQSVLPLPSGPSAAGPDEASCERTMVFADVLRSPGDGTVDLPPGVAAAAAASSAEVADQAARGADPVANVDRTIAFGDVFLLPGRSAPRSEAEIADEMHTLVGVPPIRELPDDLTPPDFDPGAVTAPMAKDAIQAMLRSGAPSSSSGGDARARAPASGPALGPGPKPEPAPRRRGLLVLLTLLVLATVALVGVGSWAAWRFGWL